MAFGYLLGLCKERRAKKPFAMSEQQSLTTTHARHPLGDKPKKRGSP